MLKVLNPVGLEKGLYISVEANISKIEKKTMNDDRQKWLNKNSKWPITIKLRIKCQKRQWNCKHMESSSDKG